MFHRILIANRGEIALRVIRAARELGIETVAVHSTADTSSLHVRFADQSICIGPPPSKESYLNIPAILSAAEVSGADAIHPGYGFLSENAEFAEMVQHSGLGWIGPRPEMIRMMGNKVHAKEAMKEAGLPQLPGSQGVIEEERDLGRLAASIGFPVILKAAAGGGGRGMKIVREKEQLVQMYRTASAESLAAFGNGDMYVERYVERPRHIEIQIVADEHGNVVHFGERECSVQRRHQKMLEESPSPALNEKLRERMGRVAVEAMRKIKYNNLGTIEFLLDERGDFYFMEMNTRIQVEHPVTESVTGIDLVKEQIRLAAGEELGRTQKSITMKGHSIECRINAEDPSRPRPASSPPTTRPAAWACASTPARTSSTASCPSTTRWWPSSSSSPTAGRRPSCACGARSRSTSSRGSRPTSLSTRSCSSTSLSCRAATTRAWSRSCSLKRRSDHRRSSRPGDCAGGR